MRASEVPVRHLTAAWLAWCALIAYGSLLPFDWRPAPPGGAVSSFMNMPWLQLGLGNRLDWLANVMLYAPAGFLGTLALQDAGRRAGAGPTLRWLGAGTLSLLISVALALAVEFAQIFVSPRTVSLNDVVAELLGAALGCALAGAAGAFLLRLLSLASLPGKASRTAWLRLYLLAYIALSLFPFDFSAATSVMAQKLASGHADWWWSPYQQARPLTALLKLALEAALVVPFGLALGSPPRRWRWPQALLCGLLVGAAIELAQLFLLSATSQGASAVSRAVGMALGAALASRRSDLSRLATPAPRPWPLLVLALPWFLVVSYLAGWGRSAVSLADWRERADSVSFLPFFHHYYAGEAQAITSVLQGIASFAGVGVALALCAPRARAGHAALAAAAVCVGLEASKLILASQHPDPTNVLVAAAAAAAGWWLSRRWIDGDGLASAPLPPPQPGPVRPAGAGPLPSAAAMPDDTRRTATAWAIATAAFIVLANWIAPGHAAGMLLGTAAFTVCAWRHPPSALLLAPVVVALTDAAAFAGHRWFEPTDLVTLATLVLATVGPGRRPMALAPHPTASGWLGVVAALLFVPGVLIGLQDAQWPDASALLGPLSPWNALLLAKGMMGAFVLAWYVRRMGIVAEAGALNFGRGMVLALAGVVFLTVKERLAFVGPFDFSSDYRAPGPFAAIALGGAYIECFLAAAAPFAVVGAFRERLRLVRWACGLLVLAAAYATMVTYSRGGQVVFLAVVGMAVVLMALPSAVTGTAGATGVTTSRPARLAAGAALAAAVAAVSISILMSPYATTRFKQLDSDAQGRLAHWKEGMDFGRRDSPALLFGNGLGSFGRESYVQGPPAGRPGVFVLQTEAGNTYLRAHPGRLSYVDQRVQATHGAPLIASARLRSTQATGLSGLLCEKDLVQSRACGVARLRMPADGQWHRVEAPITLPVNAAAGWPARPIRFTLFLGGGGGNVDVDELSLRDVPGRELLRNGDFESGAAHWLYSSDTHLVWHMKNFWLQVLFEQGLAGVLAHVALLLAGVAGAVRAAQRSAWFWPLALALLAFQGVGLIDSVIDSQRFSQLYLSIGLLAWSFGARRTVSARQAGAQHGAVRSSAQR